MVNFAPWLPQSPSLSAPAPAARPASPQQTTPQPSATSTTPMQAVTGYEIPLTAGQIAYWAAQARLGQDRLAQERQLAEAQYQADVQRFGLDVAKFNLQQRLADIDQRFRSLELLSSKAGPQDWVSYNYLLNNMKAPQPTDVLSLSQMGGGLNQPFTANMPPFPSGGAGAAAGGGGGITGVQPQPMFQPQPTPQPQQQPAQPQPQPAQQGQGTPGAPWMGIPTITTPQGGTVLGPGLNPSGQQAGFGPGGQTGGAFNQQTGIFSPNAPASAYAAHGGIFPANFTVIVGDPQKQGEPNPEKARVVDPTGDASLVVESMSKNGKGKKPKKGTPKAATGGIFGGPYAAADQFPTYSPEALGNQPFIGKLFGQQPPATFGAFGASLSNPALGLNDVPSKFSLQNYMRLRPSEQEQTQSLYEQGLGMHFPDLFAAARAGAPAGRSLGPTFYGR